MRPEPERQPVRVSRSLRNSEPVPPDRGQPPSRRPAARAAPRSDDAPPRAGATAPPVETGGPRRWVQVAALALVAAAAIGLTRSGDAVAAGDDTASPKYQRHLAGGAPVSVLLEPDRKLTREVRKSLLSGADLMVPGDPMIPAELVPELAAEDVTWCRMTFLDTCAEDGDWVSVHLSNGMVFPRFPILHAGHQIAIPVKGGVAPVATLVAEIDGQGGVTVGAISDDGVWYSSVLPVGGTQQIPVRAR